MSPSRSEIIHLGRYQEKGKKRYVVLVQKEDSFQWFLCPHAHAPTQGPWIATPISDFSIPEAIQQARQVWKYASFRTVFCGFRYPLPERDEHGQPALFCEMAQSYASFNGIYYNQKEGYNCFVGFASQEALSFWSCVPNG